MTTLSDHAPNCECADCVALMREEFHAAEEDRRWSKNFKRIRLESLKTQSELANAMQVPKSFICELEGGKRRLSLRTIRRLGSVLKLSTLEVLTRLDATELPSSFAAFRMQVAELLGFEAPADVATSTSLAALRERNKRISDLEQRWFDARKLHEVLVHRLDAVRACLCGDDVDGAKQLLSEAAPGAEGTHGAGPGAAEETTEVPRG